MNRLLALVVVALGAGVALADIGPPKGQKIVTVDHKITTGKEIPDYVFYVVLGQAVSEVKFDPKNPIVLKGAGRGGANGLGFVTALPKGAAKKYTTAKEFAEAIRAKKVEGQVTAEIELYSSILIRTTDPRNLVVEEHVFEKIDGTKLVFKQKGVAPKGPVPPGEEEEAAPGATAHAPRGGVFVAGLAAALAVTFGGMWLVGRTRRKV